MMSFVVSRMFSDMLKAYSGKTDDKAAWEEIFKYYNKTHDRGDVTYKPGEKIVIKVGDGQGDEGEVSVHPQ